MKVIGAGPLLCYQAGMGLLDIFSRKKSKQKPPAHRPTREQTPIELAELEAEKLKWLLAKVAEHEVPEDLSQCSSGDAAGMLSRLFEVQAATRSGIGNAFGMAVNSAETLAALDIDAHILRWKSALCTTYGDMGLSFLGEAASGSGIKIDGAELRIASRRLSFEPAPPKHKGPGFAGTNDPRLAELEQKLIENPEDIDACQVYADMLQEAGHVHGELIAIDCMLSKKRDPNLRNSRNALIKANSEELGGPLLKFLDREALQVRWSMGFIKSARLSGEARVSDIGTLLRKPAGRLLRELTIGFLAQDELDYEETIAVLMESGPHRALQTLFIGDFQLEEYQIYWSVVGDASPLWKAAPNLQSLILQGGEISLGAIELLELRRFAVRTGGLSLDAIKSIVSARWPKLEELEIWFGNGDYGAEADVQSIAMLFEGHGLGALKRLRLMNAEFTDDIVTALVASPLLAQLELVDLSMGTMSDTGAATLAAHMESFAHLKRLDVSDNCISEEAVAGLVAANGAVVSTEQKNAEDDPEDRFVSVGE